MPFVSIPEKGVVVNAELGMEMRSTGGNKDDELFSLSSPHGTVGFMAKCLPSANYDQDFTATWVVWPAELYFDKAKNLSANEYVEQALKTWRFSNGKG